MNNQQKLEAVTEASKIVQIAGIRWCDDSPGVVALDDIGTIWMLDLAKMEWIKLPNLPQND